MTSLVYELNRIYDLAADTTDWNGVSDMMSRKKDDLKTTIPNRDDPLWTDGVSLDVKNLSLSRVAKIGGRRSLQRSARSLPVALEWLNPSEFVQHNSEQTDYVWIETTGWGR